jgi:hypothetical protein
MKIKNPENEYGQKSERIEPWVSKGVKKNRLEKTEKNRNIQQQTRMEAINVLER